MNIFNRKFRLALLLLILTEELSFLGYLIPTINPIFFWLISLAIFIIAAWRLEIAVWLILIELIIGSKGYLFFADLFGVQISIRMVLWVAVMSAWSIRLLWTKNLINELKEFFTGLKTAQGKTFALMALFVLWGLINGFIIKNNGATDTFLDFNGWLFILLIFPVSSVLQNRKNLENLISILFAAACWVVFKTLFLAFIFSHAGMDSAAFRLYRWIRVSGLGEITQVKGGFFRIFFQSQIYSVISFLILSAILSGRLMVNKFSELLKDKTFWLNFFSIIFFLTAILFSMSRSFWIGLFVGLTLLLPYIYSAAVKNGKSIIKMTFYTIGVFSSALLISILLLVSIVTFPVPPALGGFDSKSLLDSRFDSSEAAVVSRWELLPKLWEKIASAPILGTGFGTKITYQSSDPRQLQSPARGVFTTYTFEWGWLDVWLKLGLFGFLIYLILIYQLAKKILDNGYPGDGYVNYGIFCALIAVTAIHFFSPYFNHPLGIGFLIFIYSIKQKSQS